MNRDGQIENISIYRVSIFLDNIDICRVNKFYISILSGARSPKILSKYSNLKKLLRNVLFLLALIIIKYIFMYY